jgi:hypothetical protein
MFRHDALAKGRYRRVPSRWDTEFGRWVANFGVPRIVAALARDPDLRITNQTVYEWLQGHAPRPARAVALVEMSQGRLTLDAIYQHSRQMKQTEGDSGGPR